MAEPEKSQIPMSPGDISDPTPAQDLPEEGDSETDDAVDDIVRTEGDDELKAQDEAVANAVVMKLSKRERLKQFWANPRKRWGTIVTLLLIIGGLFGVPITRYDIVGIFMREKVTVEAVDSTTSRPVSGAEIQIGSTKAETDSEGVAVLYPHTGSKHLLASKKYYDGTSQAVLITLSGSHDTFKAKLVALGRVK